MDNIKINHSSDKKQFLVNNDIEEVLSGGSGENYNNKVTINKIDDNRDIVKTDILDKVELSSNKDVDIGLELLVNKEKVNKTDIEKSNKAINLNDNSREQYRPSNHNSGNNYNNDNSDTNVIDLNTSHEVDFNTMISRGTSKIDDDLNLDRTSRLSQSEIDAFIDKNDAQNKPQLVTETDIDNLNKNDTHSKVSYHSYKSKASVEKRVAPELVNNDDIVSRTSKRSGFNQPNMEEFQQFNFDPNKERKEKEEILWQLEKYRRLGVQGVKKYNMSSDLEEMRGEYIKIKKARELENSIKFQRKCLVAFATGTELLNSKLDFLDFKLDGWSEQVNENINEYDEVFEELHEKYKEKAKMAPEIKLMFMMGGSAFMYHITNSMFKNSVPGMEDIMKQNPELMKQFANAAINQMDGEKRAAANFFNNFAPGGAPGQGGFQQPMAGNRPMPTPPEYNKKPEPMTPPQPANSAAPFGVNEVEEVSSERSAFNNSSTKIPEPVGVDDILADLKSNTNEISEITSRSSRRSGLNRSRGKRSINLNLN